VDVESLRCLVTLADELHFGRAAQLHYVSAGHFGRRIQRVERQLGARLFDRTSRRVALTPAGERVVAHARIVLAALEELRKSADSMWSMDSD
jgi:DNA-binding transcriptional LysR family regulator